MYDPDILPLKAIVWYHVNKFVMMLEEIELLQFNCVIRNKRDMLDINLLMNINLINFDRLVW